MSFEDDLGWEYFGQDPENSPRMKEHMDWHEDPKNQNQTGNYGERFLLFHKQYVDKFDAFRATKGLLPVTTWDPTTPIPASLSHDHVLMMPRDTDDPYSVNPSCKTPTWTTLAGGSDVDPIHGYTHLSEFQSLDELGRSIDAGWHGTVHNTIGGDMSMFHSPIDPIFWRWHRWVDNIRGSWVLLNSLPNVNKAAAVMMILFGITQDGPGIWIGPDGKPHRVPGGPGDPPVWRELSPRLRDALIGVAVGELAGMVTHVETRAGIQILATRLLQPHAENLFAKDISAKGKVH
jgi:Common central domain of tyrosinase